MRHGCSAGGSLLFTGLVAGVTIMCAPGKQGQEAQASTGSAAGWRTHRDGGVTIEHPDGWTVRKDAATGRIEVGGPEKERVVVWPVLLRGFRDLPPAIVAGRLLPQLASQIWPAPSWQQPESIGPRTVVLRGTTGLAETVTAAFTWSGGPEGIVGFLYGSSAPNDRYAGVAEVLAGILQSVRITGSPGVAAGGSGGAGRALASSTWRDPREGAFTLEVPQGWQVQGGLFRFAATDVRPGVAAMSPDGLVRITFGDPQIGTFFVPGPTSQWLGYAEGTVYSPGYGVQMVVRRFVPATAFAAEYVQSAIARECPGLQLTRERERPDAVAQINRIAAQYALPGFRSQRTAGEVEFTCQRNGRRWIGYYFVATQLEEFMGTGAIWHVPHLYGFVAEESTAPTARAALARLVASVVVDPQWYAAQYRTTQATAGIVTETGRAISTIINESFASSRAADDRISRQRSNSILGVEDVVDPLTGQQLQVEAGSNYYWIDQRGTIVGTETDTRPHIDFREMLIIR